MRALLLLIISCLQELGLVCTTQDREERDRVKRQEGRLAILLMAIVVTFLACNVLRLVLAVLELFVDSGEWSTGMDFMVAASKLLLVANSSINIVLYTMLNPPFCRSLTDQTVLLCAMCATSIDTPV